MTISLSERERLALIAALRLAVNTYYRDAWAFFGPLGSKPNEAAHRALIDMGDEVRDLGRRLNDPMD
jgi:hypothetical protein